MNPRAARDIEDVPGSIGGLSRLDIGLDNIGNIGKIAGLVAVVVDSKLGIVQHRLQELMKGHVWPLAWAINGEIAQRHRWDMVIMPVEHAQMFARQLCHSI